MKIELLLTCRTEPACFGEGIKIYEERLKHYTTYSRRELSVNKTKAGTDALSVKQREGELILKNIKDTDRLILLDQKGTMLSSEELAQKLTKYDVSGIRSIVFLIGGAYGFSDEVYRRADEMLSLSKMTFSHQLVRLVFLEQLYRAYTIINNQPYHNR